MEIVVPMKNFHFDDSTTSSPYVSAPSSPNHHSATPFDYYYASAPTTPTRAAALYAAAAIPFDWEEKPGTPKSPNSDAGGQFDFAFDFSGHLDQARLTAADELFEEGMIRPLKPPPCSSTFPPSPRSPKSPKGLTWSPRGRQKVGVEGFDPFAAAAAEATKERGRERSHQFSSATPSCRSRKGSRSLSPMRGAGSGVFVSDNTKTPDHASTSAAASKSGSSKKWRLRDLLLFRSASEGRATGNKSKDPLRKYTTVLNSAAPSSRGGGGEDSRNSSFRSTDSGGSVRRGASGASLHEMHYRSNRAAAEEMKKKTPLAYHRQGLFGCLRFNPAINSIARGFHNSYSFGRRQS